VNCPTPDELVTTPELGLMAAFEASLELTVRALIAAHPELDDPERPLWCVELGPTCCLAKRFVPLALELADIIFAYRRAALDEARHLVDDDLPF
jgi:hypothetical protein